MQQAGVSSHSQRQWHRFVSNFGDPRGAAEREAGARELMAKLRAREGEREREGEKFVIDSKSTQLEHRPSSFFSSPSSSSSSSSLSRIADACREEEEEGGGGRGEVAGEHRRAQERPDQIARPDDDVGGMTPIRYRRLTSEARVDHVPRMSRFLGNLDGRGVRGFARKREERACLPFSSALLGNNAKVARSSPQRS